MTIAAPGVPTSDILDEIAVALVALDREWRVTFVNAAAAPLLPVPRERLLGECLWEVFPEMVGGRAWAAYQRAVAENATVEFEEYVEPLRRWFRVRAHPSPAGLYVYSYDVTDGKRSEESLRQANEALRESLAAQAVTAAANVRLLGQAREAEEALRRANEELEQRVRDRTAELQALNERLQISNRELQDFASVASHDLQEPLRKIQAFGDRLGQKAADALGADGQDYVRRMQSAAGRMQTLINDLLSFSRVTTRAQPFRPVDLGQVAAEVLTDLETRVQQSGGRVDVGPLPTVEADPTQMRQLLQNLLGNALKFAKPGVPPVVRLDARVLADEAAVAPAPDAPAPDAILPDAPPAGGAVELSVEDNGIGFDERYLDRIFNVFQRLHGRGQYEGTGIGLAVCRKIAERHGGSITARSRPGEGSTFVVRLPLRQPEGAGGNVLDQEIPDPGPPNAPGGTPPQAPRP